MCITSNVHTGLISSPEDHPFREYFDRGLRVTINTDNRLMSSTTVSEEIATACRVFDLSIYDLRKILIHGFKSAFLPFGQKSELLRTSLTEIDDLFEEYFPGDYKRLRTFL
jgi:adenosine deaminase